MRAIAVVMEVKDANRLPKMPIVEGKTQCLSSPRQISLVVMACLIFYKLPQRLLKEECPLLHSEARHTAVVVSVTLIAEKMTMKQN